MAKYIDAEKVIAALTDTLQYEGMVMDELISVVANIPAADVAERKTGKWLWLDGVRCSNCNHKLQTTGLTSYCPNCGSYNGGENEV